MMISEERRLHSILDHRIIGYGLAFMAVLGILKFFFPIGLIAWVTIFIFHHHPAEAAVIKRQHDIMSFTLFVAGLYLLIIRINPTFEFIKDVWIWAILILAYLYLAYSEKGIIYDPHHDHTH